MKRLLTLLALTLLPLFAHADTTTDFRVMTDLADTATIKAALTTTGLYGIDITINSVTASRVPYFDADKKIATSSVTPTELGYLFGVTSAIQAQFSGKQNLDATLTSLAAYNTNGLLTQTAADTFSGRTITGTSLDIVATNGDGVSGNPTLTLDRTATLAGNPALSASNASFATTGIIAEGSTADSVETLLTFTDPTATDKTITFPNASGTVMVSASSPMTLSALGDLTIDATLVALAAYNTNGLLTQTAADTFTGRTITGTSFDIVLSNGNGVSGNPTLTLDRTATIGADPALTASYAAFSTTGFIFEGSTADTIETLINVVDPTASDKTISFPNASGTVMVSASSPMTLSALGNLTIDATLVALASYNTNGLLTQTAADTFTGRTLTGTSLDITVSNGDGVSANPTLTLDRTATLAGNPALAASNAAFATTGIIFEGSSADNNEGLLVSSNVGSDITWTLPTAGGTIAVSTGLPLSLDAAGNITIADAQANASTKGASTYATADFNDASGLISIDYTNGQASASGVKGFLTGASFDTFTAKYGSGSSPVFGATVQQGTYHVHYVKNITGVADNTATELFTVTNAGSNGSYSASVKCTLGAGAVLYRATKLETYAWSRAQFGASGTSSAVTAGTGSGVGTAVAATAIGNLSFGTITATAPETSEAVTSFKIQADLNPNDVSDTVDVTVEVDLEFTGFGGTAPTIS